MKEIRYTTDPISGKRVSIRDDLVLRLRGQYVCVPTLPNGEPEFGWLHYPTVPIQEEAAIEIERLRAALAKIASCESYHSADVVAVARAALAIR